MLAPPKSGRFLCVFQVSIRTIVAHNLWEQNAINVIKYVFQKVIVSYCQVNFAPLSKSGHGNACRIHFIFDYFSTDISLIKSGHTQSLK